jgi:hypothetical protein
MLLIFCTDNLVVLDERPTEIISVSYRTILFKNSNRIKNISPLEAGELHGKKLRVFPGIY